MNPVSTLFSNVWSSDIEKRIEILTSDAYHFLILFSRNCFKVIVKMQ
jgi:hypothetical protein